MWPFDTITGWWQGLFGLDTGGGEPDFDALREEEELDEEEDDEDDEEAPTF